ncbi:hypothetical protein GCM10010320_07320 [Streptomyces caelestis]|nr:hypothetical protein GCM10010320_07320 [Streptomyces caelestis]
MGRSYPGPPGTLSPFWTCRYSKQVVITPVRGKAGAIPALTRNREPSPEAVSRIAPNGS